MSDQTNGGELPVQLWTRDGFMGAISVVTRSTYAPDYLSAEGPHAPRRAVLDRLIPDDQDDAQALPTTVATSRLGVKLLVSGRRKPMPLCSSKCRSRRNPFHSVWQCQIRNRRRLSHGRGR